MEENSYTYNIMVIVNALLLLESIVSTLMLEVEPLIITTCSWPRVYGYVGEPIWQRAVRYHCHYRQFNVPPYTMRLPQFYEITYLSPPSNWHQLIIGCAGYSQYNAYNLLYYS